jgi:hypothetical protein
MQRADKRSQVPRESGGVIPLLVRILNLSVTGHNQSLSLPSERRQ